MRKVALRLGELADDSRWLIRPESLTRLLKRKITLDGLKCFWVKREGGARHEISLRVRPRDKALKNQSWLRRDGANRSAKRTEAQST